MPTAALLLCFVSWGLSNAESSEPTFCSEQEVQSQEQAICGQTSANASVLETDVVLDDEAIAFLLDYALWRQWESVVIFYDDHKGFGLADKLALADAFSEAGIFMSFHSFQRPQFPLSVAVRRHFLGIVILCSGVTFEDFLHEVSQRLMFNMYLSWVFFWKGPVPSEEFQRLFSPINLSVDSSVVVVDLRYSLQQLHKVRYSGPLLLEHLGTWSLDNGTLHLRRLLLLEDRTNFLGESIVVGIKNVTVQDSAAEHSNNENAPEDETDSNADLIEILKTMVAPLNASYQLVSFSKLGWKNDENAWLHLLGAVTAGTVDIGLENVVVNKEMSNDMFFSLPIAVAMRNIYFRRPESSALRDIFLEPFSPILIGCVTTTGVLLGGTMFVALTISRHKSSRNRRWRLSDALLWAVALLCMQGSHREHRGASCSILLIIGLFFTMIIYNSYAAFITSVLSVKESSIKDLRDLLNSDLHFGYTKSGSDEDFLRVTDDSKLKEFYLRGLAHNRGVETHKEGLLKASRGAFAFIISAREARKALATFMPWARRCDMMELSVPSSRSVVAFPMPNTSPYKRIINLSLMKMKEVGILSKLRERILPPLPPCNQDSLFNSARLSDVYSAFSLLGMGLIAAIALYVAEYIWNKKHKIRQALAVKHKLKTTVSPPQMVHTKGDHYWY